MTKFVTKTSTSKDAKMDNGGIKLAIWNLNGASCETRGQLDNKDVNDFELGAIDVFQDQENLGKCFHFELPDKVWNKWLRSIFLKVLRFYAKLKDLSIRV